MAQATTRRALFARFRGGPPQLRPPWSLPEDRFADACTACGDCIKACPQGILARGHGNLPIVTFDRGACTFCGSCAGSCGQGCFATDLSARPWGLVAVVSPACVEAKGIACRMCEAACDAAAIRFRPRLGGRSDVLIDQASCSGCGACLGHCPVGALSVREPSQEEVRA